MTTLLRHTITAGLATIVLAASSYFALRPNKEVPPAVTVVATIDPTQYTAPPRDATIWSQFTRQVESAVVCIRNQATYEISSYSALTSQKVTYDVDTGSHGTGTVFSSVQTPEGKTEYRILTNFHVQNNDATMAFNVGTGKLERSRLNIVTDADDAHTDDDIRLRVIATDPNQDMAILETVGAKQSLPVADVVFGSPKKLDKNDLLITAGYPFGRNKQTNDGKIGSVEFIDQKVLPYPGQVYTASLDFDPGMSGSPVGVPLQGPDGTIKFYVIALIYASAPGTDTIRLLTPMDGDALTFIKTQQSAPTKRPLLSESVSMEQWKALRHNDQNTIDATYELLNQQYVLREVNGNPVIRRFDIRNGLTLNKTWVDIELSISNNTATLRSATSHSGQRDRKTTFNEEDSEYYGKVFQGVLNQFHLQQQYRELLQSQEVKSETTRMTEYLQTVVNESENILTNDLRAFDKRLRVSGIMPHTP